MGKIIKRTHFLAKIASILFVSILLVSCATEKNIPLTEAFWEQKPKKVAVAVVKPHSTPGITMKGQQGLLDYAINSVMTQKMEKKLNQTDLSWYYSMPNEFTHKMNQLKVSANPVEVIKTADAKSYPALAAQHDSDKVLVIQLQALGAVRDYTGFIPMSAPKAYCVLKGELIDVRTNKVLWRHLAEVTLPVQGQWDQPPAYPNLTQQVKVAIETSRQEILDSFFSGQPITS